MAGELIVKNGLRVSGSTIIVGSITATSITGSISGSITSATSASYAATASVLLGSVTSASFASTASYWSGSVTNVTSASFAATSSFPWFQTGSNIAYAGGNVGIGTTSPTTPLYISSSANTGLLIKTPNPTLQLTDASDTWYIQGVSGDRLRVTRGGSTDLFTVKSNGDVGIGIGATAPSARLQVRGAGTTSATTALLVENANTSASLLVRGDGYVGIGTATPAYRLEVYGNPTNATINLAKSDGDQYLRLVGGSGGANQLIQTSYNLGIDVGGAGNRAMTFLSGSANVGIGTSSPSFKLDVSGSGRFTNGLTVTGSVIATSFTGSLSGSVTAAISASYALSSSFASTASYWSGSILNSTSASFAATASFVNALSQSVLISGSLRALTVEPTNLSTNYFPKKSGTFLTSSVLNSNDDAVLHWGPATITPATPNSRGIIIYGLNYSQIMLRVSGSTGNDGYMMQARPGGNFAFSNIANNTQIFALASDVAVQALTILGAGGNIAMGQFGGNVGINWANAYTIPAKLYVSGSVRFDGATTINGTGTTSATTAFTVKNANASSSLVVRDDGRVGIGTSTPTSTFEVNGSATVSGSIVQRGPGIYVYDINGYGGGRIYGGYAYAGGEVFIRPLNGNSDNFVFSPTNGMSIGGFTIGGTTGSPPAYGLAVSGSVGIGTRLPTTQLDVSGSGRFTGNLTVTGSVIGTSFTGSLFGTASYATFALGTNTANTASFVQTAQTASYVLNAVSSSFAVSSSRAVSSSFATTASYWSGSILNATSASFASTASFYGGSVTSASFASTASRVNTLNQNVTILGALTVTGSILSTATITAGQHIEAQVNLKSMYQAGDEGGEIFLNAPATSTTINSGVNIDVYQDKLRFWEDGGVNRGFYLDMTTGAPGVGTNLKPAGYTGIVAIAGNPPGQQNLDFQNGILVNVF